MRKFRNLEKQRKFTGILELFKLIGDYFKLVNEDEEEDEEVRNKMLGSLEFLAIKNSQNFLKVKIVFTSCTVD